MERPVRAARGEGAPPYVLQDCVSDAAAPGGFVDDEVADVKVRPVRLPVGVAHGAARLFGNDEVRKNALAELGRGADRHRCPQRGVEVREDQIVRGSAVSDEESHVMT
jgi:hypothetical protein